MDFEALKLSVFTSFWWAGISIMLMLFGILIASFHKPLGASGTTPVSYVAELMLAGGAFLIGAWGICFWIENVLLHM